MEFFAGPVAACSNGLGDAKRQAVFGRLSKIQGSQPQPFFGDSPIRLEHCSDLNGFSIQADSAGRSSCEDFENSPVAGNPLPPLELCKCFKSEPRSQNDLTARSSQAESD